MKLPANWKTTLTGSSAALMAALTFVAALSYDLGPLAMVLPPEWKPIVVKLAGIATVILWIWNSVQQKDRDVTGGTIQQDVDGNVVVGPIT